MRSGSTGSPPRAVGCSSDGMAEAAAVTLREALGLWRGPALEDFDDDFARGDRIRLEELRATALELRIDADLALGRHEQVAAELATLTSEHPLRERLWGQQMLALYRAGRQGEALRAYQAARTALGEELGLDPGPELQRLEAAILARDPALDLDDRGCPPTAPPTRRVGPVGNLPVPISSFVGRVEEIEHGGGSAARAPAGDAGRSGRCGQDAPRPGGGDRAGRASIPTGSG